MRKSQLLNHSAVIARKSFKNLNWDFISLTKSLLRNFLFSLPNCLMPLILGFVGNEIGLFHSEAQRISSYYMIRSATSGAKSVFTLRTKDP